MAAVNAGVPLDWLGNLAAIPTASAAQETPSSDEPVPLLQRLLLGDSALLGSVGLRGRGHRPSGPS